MAYGQTSSGKSYTLLGGESEGSEGILPRFVQELFSFKERAQYDQFEVKCSFFEIYNEQIYDLLQEGESKLNLFQTGHSWLSEKTPGKVYSLKIYLIWMSLI